MSDRTADAQKFWDDVFLLALRELRYGHDRRRGVEGRAHLAREQADIALEERRRSQQQQR